MQIVVHDNQSPVSPGSEYDLALVATDMGTVLSCALCQARACCYQMFCLALRFSTDEWVVEQVVQNELQKEK